MATSPTDAIVTEGRRVSMLEARRRGLSKDDADDVAQEIAIKLLLILKADKPIKHVPAWTRRATANYIIDEHRKKYAAKYGGGLLVSLTEVVTEGD